MFTIVIELKINVKKPKLDGSKACRVPSYRPGFEATETFLDNVYDTKTEELLCDINLGKYGYVDGVKRCVLDKLLRCSNWNYPKEPGESSVPTNGVLFSVFQAMLNLQLCGGRFMCSYLVKYVAKLQQRKSVYFQKVHGNIFDTNYNNSLPGEKAKRTANSNIREICLPEMVWKLLDLPYVITNVTFSNYSTHAPEH